MAIAVPTVVAGAAPMALASLPTSADQDPIFEAIAENVAAITELERQLALHETGLIDDYRPLNAAGANIFQCAQVVVDTAATTPAGLLALADHLRQHFSYGSGFALCIERPFGGSMMGGGVGAVEWLLKKRAAEIVGAA
jgi:hypothetical protein